MKQTQICYPHSLHLPPSSSTQPTATQAPTLAAVVETPAQANLHVLRDGEVVIYRRTRSSVWQCRYKLSVGGWQRVSTRKTALEHAVRVGCELYDEARFRERLGLEPVHKTFADIARSTLAELKRDLAAGTGKKIYVDYVSIIERYFVPFFGDKHLQNIKHNDIANFERWRNDKMGKRPKSSTLSETLIERLCA